MVTVHETRDACGGRWLYSTLFVLSFLETNRSLERTHSKVSEIQVIKVCTHAGPWSRLKWLNSCARTLEETGCWIFRLDLMMPQESPLSALCPCTVAPTDPIIPETAIKWLYSVMVSTSDSDSGNLGSIPGTTFVFCSLVVCARHLVSFKILWLKL
jgi:hypothetical protein